jgi:hypothetical protein
MSYWSKLMTKFLAGYKAFREPELISDLTAVMDGEYGDFESRRLRYAIYWAMYENTVYRDGVHKWSKAYKTRHGLYRYIRGIYNPTYRLGEFWKTHVWGGSIDEAIPIVTDIDGLQAAIDQVYRWSNWQIYKDVVSLHGSVLGDVGIMVVDDAARGKVYLDVIHPGTVKQLETDDFGNVKAYVLQEQRLDPQRGSDEATYTEEAFRDGDNVVYRTFLNGKPFDWSGDGRGVEYTRPYGFIPLVMVQHNNVGQDWGWSELHPGRQKFSELDDLASNFHDYVRKSVNAPMLLAGIDQPRGPVNTTRTQATESTAADNHTPGREELPFLYGPVGATVAPVLANLDIASTLQAIQQLLLNIEEDYPELKVSRRAQEVAQEKSGKAIREARKEAESKVKQRRQNYDDALIRANQMAVAIGGFNGYSEVFTGFSLDSYAAGQLDHTIGDRPVFGSDPLDKYEVETAQASAWAVKWEAAQIPIVTRWREILRDNGVTEDEMEAGLSLLLADQQRQDDFGLADTVTGISQ